MQILRSILIAAAFGITWVSIALFQGQMNWQQVLGGFLLFVVVGPVLAILVRILSTWWKDRS